MNNESYNLDDEFETICIDILSKSPIYVSNMLIDLYGFLPDVFRGSILKIVGFSSAILHFSNWSEYLQILSEYDVIEIINKSIGILCDRWNNIDYDSIHSIHGDEWDKMVSHSVNPSIIQDYKKIRMDSLTVPNDSMSKYEYVFLEKLTYSSFIMTQLENPNINENDLKNIFFEIDNIFLKKYYGTEFSKINIRKGIEYSISYCLNYMINEYFSNC